MQQISMADDFGAADVFEEIRRMVRSIGIDADALACIPREASGEFTVKVMEKPMCGIAIKAKSRYVNLKYDFFRNVEKYEIPYVVTPSQEGSYVRLPFANTYDIEKMKPVLLKAFEAAYMANADSSFGCCHRFIECSDARKCTAPDVLFGIGCMYRKNLEAGRIFYGKNRNI